MHALAAFLVFAQAPSAPVAIERDNFGVPYVRASGWSEAFRLAGRAVAEDRLWQMELSRRQARGRMAEIMGSGSVASDREAINLGYTDDELRAQLARMSSRGRQAFDAYSQGVNEAIQAMSSAGTLPEGYAKNQFTPEPWTPLDSAAIAVRMGQMFGSGGAGELRNLALLKYLESQGAGPRALDVLNDLAWQNDPEAVTTAGVDEVADPDRPRFPNPTPEETRRHLAAIPNVSALELLPAVQRLLRAESELIAQRYSLPYKTGSYAMVVGPDRSATGRPILLSAPQMGHFAPAIIHEIAIDAPEFRVRGMNVPGIPGVLIGMTPHMAWGLTTGVADVRDIFFNPIEGEGYRRGERVQPFVTFDREIKVKGGEPQQVTVRRTSYGPVVLESRSTRTVFSVRSGWWMRELEGFDDLYNLYGAKNAQDVKSIAEKLPLAFNLFFATTSGDFGWHYVGAVPLRPEGIDPRLPLPGDGKHDWTGWVPAEKMPRSINPSGGLLLNWNDKPVSWWPNLDTPAWGRLWRGMELRAALTGKRQIGIADLEMAAWRIARRDEQTMGVFAPLFRAALLEANLTPIEAEARRYLEAFDGWMTQGLPSATIYQATVNALREELFLKTTGNFLSDGNFRLVVQPSVLLRALNGQTAFDYRAGRSSGDVIVAAFKKAVARLAEARGQNPAAWGFVPPSLSYGDESVLYSERGSMIQIVELSASPVGRNVIGPGVAESGRHSRDQVPLVRQWSFKPMRGF